MWALAADQVVVGMGGLPTPMVTSRIHQNITHAATLSVAALGLRRGVSSRSSTGLPQAHSSSRRTVRAQRRVSLLLLQVGGEYPA